MTAEQELAIRMVEIDMLMLELDREMEYTFDMWDFERELDAIAEEL